MVRRRDSKLLCEWPCSSDADCADVFEVRDPGAVLLYMAEDAAPVVKAASKAYAVIEGWTSAPCPSTSSPRLLHVHRRVNRSVDSRVVVEHAVP